MQTKFICARGGTPNSITPKWRFLARSLKGYAPQLKTLTGGAGSGHLVKSSSKKSYLTVSKPSASLNGIYYCEWKTSYTIQRSPAFEIEMKIGKTCVRRLSVLIPNYKGMYFKPINSISVDRSTAWKYRRKQGYL
jgi:hypothetical protein